MRRLWLVFLVAGIVMALGTSLLVAAASFRFVHPRAPELRFVVDRQGNVKLDLASVRAARAPRTAGKPRIVVPESVFDFGVMNPFTRGHHDFEIRNEGDGPLVLRNAGTTCKCTIASLAREPVAPGRSAHVRLEWHTGNESIYSHGATLETSDPDCPSVELRVRGRVQRVCEFVPGDLSIPALAKGRIGTATVDLVSTVWDDLTILSGNMSVPGMKWKAVPLAADELRFHGARSGFRIHIETPNDLPVGAYADVLSLQVGRHSEPDLRSIAELPIAGSVLGRFSVFGPYVDELGQIDLGGIERGQEETRKLIVCLRVDEPLDASTFQVSVQPDFVRASISERARSKPGHRLYDLTLTIPEDAPECTYLDANPAALHIAVPANPPLDIRLRLLFAVAGP